MDEKKMTEFSFRKGWYQVKQGEARDVRAKIMSALNIATRMAFIDRLNGKYEPRVTEAKAIESIFAEHGITDIWGAA
jgi:hypothetical protein